MFILVFKRWKQTFEFHLKLLAKSCERWEFEMEACCDGGRDGGLVSEDIFVDAFRITVVWLLAGDGIDGATVTFELPFVTTHDIDCCGSGCCTDDATDMVSLPSFRSCCAANWRWRDSATLNCSKWNCCLSWSNCWRWCSS